MSRFKVLSSSVIISVCEKYQIEKPDAFSQDWMLEVCDPDRVEEWVGYYEQKANSDDEKFALMGIILSSSDEALADGQLSEQTWERIASLIVKDFLIQQHWVHYWCSWEHSEEELEDAFALTPLMRGLNLSSPSAAAEWFGV